MILQITSKDIENESNILCFKEKVNRAIRDLIVAIVDSTADRSQIGGPIILEHFLTV